MKVLWSTPAAVTVQDRNCQAGWLTSRHPPPAARLYVVE